MDEENKSAANMQEKPKEATPASLTDNDPAKQMDDNPESVSGNHNESGNYNLGNVNLEEGKSSDQVNLADCQESVNTAGSISENKGNSHFGLWSIYVKSIASRRKFL